ncbi:MAG: hypothetical protein HOP15_18205 [Planctomycetes bacterium]|nr:hypothetical protein [Planctomycetota bacterium]
MSAPPRSWIRLWVLAAALVLGAWLRLRGLTGLPLHGDEHHTVLAADRGYGEILTTFDGVGSHVPLPLLQRLSLDVFGDGVVPYRLVAIVPGLLLLLLAYPLLCAFVDRSAAALASVALALNPMMVFYARFARGYALALLLALGLGWALRRVLERDERRRSTWVALIACAALLPWVHLSTLGFVLAVALAGVLLAARESRAAALRLGAALAVAGVVSLLLFVPVFGQVVAYFRANEPEPAPLDWLGVPTLLAGGRAAAWGWLALVPLGAWFAWRERRKSVVLALAALLGPLSLLLATRPSGMDYAWARYLLSGLPFLAALGATAFGGLARLVPRLASRQGETLALLAGAGLCLAQYGCGPLGPRAPRDGSFSNTYLALHGLPAFDEPYPDAPELYRTLAADPAVERIVEAPSIYTRSVLLYRSHALLHGKEVVIGWTGEPPRALRRGPYVRLLEIEAGEADWLVLHRDLGAEVMDYFGFVFEQVWPRHSDPADESFMRRQEAIHDGNLAKPELAESIAAKLVERYGAPTYEDRRIYAWRLAP